MENLEALIGKLQAAFGDPDRKATAKKRLLTLKQTTKDFPTFYAEFSRYAAETNWDVNAKRGLMRNALCYELKADLVGQSEPDDFDQWIALLQRLDSKRRQLAGELSRRIKLPNATSPRPTNTAAPPRAPAPASATPATSGTATTTATGTAPGPMDLSAGRKRLSPEERKKRMDEGRCVYCGGLGHIARNCRNAPSRTIRVAEATITPRSEPQPGAQPGQGTPETLN